MELFESKDLRAIIFDEKTRKTYDLSLDEKKFIAEQLCKAVVYLHSPRIGIIHEDIKPGNVLVDKYLKVKLYDLSLSRTAGMPMALNTIVGRYYRGTPMYMAPELLLREKSASTKSDVWSLACTIKELFSGTYVWPANYYMKDIKKTVQS